MRPANSPRLGDPADYVWSKNGPRRNLTASQWACVAVEAEEIIAAIRETVAKSVGGRPRKVEEKPSQLIDAVSANDKRSDAKAAELFNTNRTYINEAAKLKAYASDKFERARIETRQLIAESQPDDKKSSAKAAELFSTNRTYINEAQAAKCPPWTVTL